MALPETPDIAGQDAEKAPNDDTFETEKPSNPDTLYGVEKIPSTDVRFDGPFLQAMHKHPILGTIGVLILGSVLAGIATVCIQTMKCGRMGVA